jgi:methylation protein EvaC
MRNRVAVGAVGRESFPHCQFCGGKTIAGLDLGSQPLGDSLLTRAELGKPETYHPLRLRHCEDCGLAQLGYIVGPAARRKLSPVDGELMKARISGVDVSVPWSDLDEKSAETILATHGRAEHMQALGVWDRVADPERLLRGVARLLKPTGIFISEGSSWMDMEQTGRFDNISHTRWRYSGLRPLLRLFARFNLDIFDARQGETLQVDACFAGSQAIHPRVGDLVAEEEASRIYTPEKILGWVKAVEKRRWDLRDRVLGLVRDGRKVIGVGAGANASTVCHSCRIGPETIDYIADSNPRHAGRYLPGVHIPIVEEEKMFTDPRPADAVVLFGGTFASARWRGELIRP